MNGGGPTRRARQCNTAAPPCVEAGWSAPAGRKGIMGFMESRTGKPARKGEEPLSCELLAPGLSAPPADTGEAPRPPSPPFSPACRCRSPGRRFRRPADGPDRRGAAPTPRAFKRAPRDLPRAFPQAWPLRRPRPPAAPVHPAFSVLSCSSHAGCSATREVGQALGHVCRATMALSARPGAARAALPRWPP